MMNMVPNCILEAKGWTGTQEQGKVYLNDLIMELLGDKLESMTRLQCADCELFEDCQPRPLFEHEEFVGLKIDI
jgi:hypothetical protein